LAAHGGPDHFLLQTVAEPALKPGHVLIKVAATSLNPIDAKIRGGLPIAPALPAILHGDVAGTVSALGEGVSDLEVGGEVYGCAGGVRGTGGALAELMLADARLLAPKPRTLSLRESAALPLVAITAWEALERAGVKAGDHVLVHGGTGGVGHVAVQLAKARGARVTATVRRDDAVLQAEKLGADAVVDTSKESVADYVGRLTGGAGFDVVVDTIGGASLDEAFAAAAINGRVSATAARSTHDLSPLHAKGLSLHVVFMLIPMLHDKDRQRHGRILAEVAALVDAGKVKPLIDPHPFTLATVADAHRHFEAGRARGKIVIDIA
jgi:NADPH2:quinone reductase